MAYFKNNKLMCLDYHDFGIILEFKRKKKSLILLSFLLIQMLTVKLLTWFTGYGEGILVWLKQFVKAGPTHIFL